MWVHWHPDYQCLAGNVVVSQNKGTNHPFLWDFPQPSIFGYLHLWKPPYLCGVGSQFGSSSVSVDKSVGPMYHLWHISFRILNTPVYPSLGGPHDTSHCFPRLSPVMVNSLLGCQPKYCGWLRNPASLCLVETNNGMFTTVFNWWFGFPNHPP